ncbi:MAG: hypothetical protein WEB53_15675 [Akkermansiaceae bacterium]
MSAYLAGVQRLGTLWDQLDEHDAGEECIADEQSKTPDETCHIVRLEKLTICTPGNQKTLVKELSFELNTNGSLIIIVASGTGKSSVLRTIAGIWYGSSGLLERLPFDHLMFLPQRPYMVEGTLRDQLLYPYPNRATIIPDHDRLLKLDSDGSWEIGNVADLEPSAPEQQAAIW